MLARWFAVRFPIGVSPSEFLRKLFVEEMRPTASGTNSVGMIAANWSRPIPVNAYLSEMAVSDRHGGGLTLQRVLGEDLNAIRVFAQIGRFAKDFPIVERYRDRVVSYEQWFESDKARRWLGSRPCRWILRRKSLQRSFAVRTAIRLLRKLDELASPTLLVCPQGRISLMVVEEMKRRRPIQYVTWVMDDHLIRYKSGSKGEESGRLEYDSPATEQLMKDHLCGAVARFVISPAMAELYRDRFGCDSAVLFGPAIQAHSPLVAPPSGDLEGSRIGYFGSVGDWQLDPLLATAHACTATGSKLDIYAGNSIVPRSLQAAGATVCPPVAPTAVLGVMREYDAVLLPISFAPAQRNMSELNIATKMSECLASGTVTLAMGPGYSAMVRYLRNRGGAIVVDSLDSNNISQALLNLKNRSVRAEVVARANELAVGELSTESMRAVWRSSTKFTTPIKNLAN